MQIYTIGFTGKSARKFFEILKQSNIQLLVDVRLHNTSQLSGFSKRDDLAYFLEQICHIEYRHELLLAPEAEMLAGYRSRQIPWSEYQKLFSNLLASRKIESKLDRKMFETPTVLLCSEADFRTCHRSLVVNYLSEHWGSISTCNL